MVERLVGVLLQRGTEDRIVDDSNGALAEFSPDRRNQRPCRARRRRLRRRAARTTTSCGTPGVLAATCGLSCLARWFDEWWRLSAFASVQSWRRRWPRYWNDRGRTSPRRAARGGENESWREWRTHVPYAQLTDPHRRRKGFEVGRFSKRSDQQDDVESTIRERAGQVGEDAFRACGPEVGDEEDDLPIHGVHGFPVARGFRRRRPFGDDITERLFATLLHAGFSGRLPSAEAVVAIGRLHNGP